MIKTVLRFGTVRVTALLIIFLAYFILKSYLKRRKKTPPGPWGIPVFGALPHFALRASSVGVREVFRDWHNRYGPIYGMKLGVANVVVLNDFRSIKDALTHPDFQDRIKFDFTVSRPGEGIISSNGRVWREQRKFIHNHFREFGVGKARFEKLVAAEADFLTESLLEYEGKSIDLTHLVHHAVSNVIAAVTLGRRYDYKDEIYRSILQKVNETTASSTVQTTLSVLLPFIKYLPFGGVKKLVANLEDVDKFYYGVVEEHRTTLDENDIADAMDAYLLEIKRSVDTDLADVFKFENMYWTIADLFGAGTETTTSTLRWVFLFLLNHPDVEKRLRSELESVVGRNRLPRYSDRPNLPYLEAVISEALRLGTSSSVSLPRVTSSDVTFHSYHIPKGTIILPNHHTLFTEESKWKDPERFWPERFLDDEGKYIKREEFIPFGTGRRLCIGESLARMEIFIFITHIMQKMKFSVPEGKAMPSMDGIVAFTYQPKPYEVFISKCM